MAETQSYGEITILEEHETEKEIRVALLWKYANSYDDKTGTAQILFRLINRPVAVAFELSVLTESGSILMFKGYVNESLNWNPIFNCNSHDLI